MDCWSNFAIFPYIFHYSGSPVFLVKDRRVIYFKQFLQICLSHFEQYVYVFVSLYFSSLGLLVTTNHTSNSSTTFNTQMEMAKSLLAFKAQNVSNFKTQEHKMLKNRSFLRRICRNNLRK